MHSRQVKITIQLAFTCVFAILIGSCEKDAVVPNTKAAHSSASLSSCDSLLMRITGTSFNENRRANSSNTNRRRRVPPPQGTTNQKKNRSSRGPVKSAAELLEDIRLTCPSANAAYAEAVIASIAIEASPPEGNIELSIAAVNKLLNHEFLQDNTTHPTHRFQILRRKKNYLNNIRRYEDALQLSHYILKVGKDANDIDIVSNELNYLTHTHCANRNIDSAIVYATLAESIYAAAGTPEKTALVYTTICYGANQGSTSPQHLNMCYKALKLANSGNGNEIAGALQALGTVYAIGERFDSAAHYFHKALAYRSKMTWSPFAEAQLRNSLATVLALNGDSDAALRQIDTLSTIKINNPGWPSPATNFAKAVVYDNRGNSEEAYELLSTLLNTHNSNPRIATSKTISSARELMLRLSSKLGRPASLSLIDTIIQQAEERLVIERKSFSAQLDAQFESGKRTAQIESLEQIQNSQADALTNRNYALTGGALAIILLSGGGLALFRQRNSLTRANAQVNTLNQELNHRSASQINLAYQLILNQQHTLKDDQARGALAATEAQLLALKVVNEQLANSSSDRVFVKDVLTKVSKNLQQASPESFQLTLDIEAIELPADQVTKAALVVNELITNSIKYALTPQTGGHIELSLKRQGESIALRYKDNGPGKDGKNRGTGLGTSLIAVLLEDLEAEIHEPRNEKGYRFEANWDRA